MAVTSLGNEPARERPAGAGPHRISGGLLDPRQLWKSIPGALRKLNPYTLWRNPVMFIVEIGSVFTTVLAISHPTAFAWVITGWLWLTVVFANLAEAVAEGRGKAQADALRKAKTDTMARRLVGWSPVRPAWRRNRCRRRSCNRATSWSSRPGRRSRATGMSWKASRRSTSRRSPASPRR
ncbi:hypothetical protein Athai_67730 [Actinocatenispora thailandica]|uniref:Uncharacterized protein n=1 Tax=Actinocatenispora thailandica TaxID=227318 RepID=A0A7R7DWQ3_9ACTN|nr:hypothetical protein [Actinocatenispora thailandica]BCJ39270.1 hypothetical protein Athai_67730 [Actinocatenispora thailandica]